VVASAKEGKKGDGQIAAALVDARLPVIGKILFECSEPIFL
jgi:hypothetical protein